MLQTDDLKKVGFEKIGEWLISNESLTYSIENFKPSPCLYAFCLKDKVYYLGLTYNNIKKRLDLYKNVSERSGSTNKEVNKKLLSLLKQNVRSHISVLCLFEENYNMDFKGIKISLAGGLEYPLIKKFDPPWNKRKGGNIYLPIEELPKMNTVQLGKGPEEKDKKFKESTLKILDEISFNYQDEKLILKHLRHGSDFIRLYGQDGTEKKIKMLEFLRKLNNDLKLGVSMTSHTNTDGKKVITALKNRNK